MANVKFSRKEFEKHIKLTKEIEEKISMLGTHLESTNDNEIELEILPNRPDLFSLQGFIRAFSAFLRKKTGLKKYKLKKPEKDFQVTIDKSVEQVRPFTACAIVKNLKFDDEKIKEVIDIQEKIHSTLGRNRKKIAIGIYPLEKIKLPITFTARKPQDINFIPLESEKEMNGLQILQQHPAGREYAHLLEGKEKFPVFIDANNEILSMPPIINSHKTGKITQETKDIFIECSGFDLEILKKTLNILATMFADMHGEVYQMRLRYKKVILTPNFEPEKIKTDVNDINKLLGLNLKEAEIKKLAEKMGYDYKNKQVSIPCYRTDIMHPVDIYEDIAIAYGYENFKPEVPQVQGTGKEKESSIKIRKISEILAGLGMLETNSLHLLTKEDSEKSGIKNAIELENSKTDYKFLRNNMLTSSLKILASNSDAEYPQKIFEIGAIFLPDEKEETGIKETNNLVVSLAPGNFTEIKQILEYLGRMLDIKFEIEEASHYGFIEGRCGKIQFNDKEIGVIGEISPQTLKNWRIKMPVASLELNVDEIIN